jgi:hypothetical protein
VAYGFDPGRRLAWLEPVVPGRVAGGLCRRHADAMVVPRGWSLDDRRIETADHGVASPVPPPPDATAEWSPIAVARTELTDVLDPATPLLARAFGRSGALSPGRPAAG